MSEPDLGRKASLLGQTVLAARQQRQAPAVAAACPALSLSERRPAEADERSENCRSAVQDRVLGSDRPVALECSGPEQALERLEEVANNWIVGTEARNAARQRAEQASAALDRIAPDGFAAMQARVIEAYNRQDFPAMLQRAQLWVERHPHPVACGALGAALNHTDQPEAAMPWFERALRLSPLDSFRAEWMYRLALAHYIADNLDRAVEWAQKAQSTNPLLPWPPVQAAALLQLGRRAEAQASWDDFHRRHPGYDRAAVLRRLGGDFPRFAAARARLIENLGDLGMR